MTIAQYSFETKHFRLDCQCSTFLGETSRCLLSCNKLWSISSLHMLVTLGLEFRAFHLFLNSWSVFDRMLIMSQLCTISKVNFSKRVGRHLLSAPSFIMFWSSDRLTLNPSPADLWSPLLLTYVIELYLFKIILQNLGNQELGYSNPSLLGIVMSPHHDITLLVDILILLNDHQIRLHFLICTRSILHRWGFRSFP